MDTHAVPRLETQATAMVDWQATRQKIARMQAATQHGTKISTEQQLLLLKERAHLLAQTPVQQEAVGEQLDITEFRLETETYAFESSSVREVYFLKGLTTLPGTPPFVLGIVNVRGRILPVIDIAPLFGFSSQEVRAQSKSIIVQAEELEVGILTESVIGVRQLPLSALHPPLSTLTIARSRYLRGITTDGLVVLDAQKLLAATRLGSQE
ncbi:MAG: chemotaxis protein CheW [Candidatus Binatia bacterium]